MAKSRLYLEQELTENFSQAITLALNLLEKSNNVSTEEKEEITEKLGKIKYNRRHLIDIYRKILLEEWRNFKEPKMDRADAHSLYEKSKLEKIRSNNQLKQDVTKQESRLQDMTEEIEVTVAEFHDVTVELDNAEYRLDPDTGEVDRENPLKYSKPLRMEDFTEHIIKSTVTKSIDINATLRALMKESQRIGLTRKTFGRLLKMMVQSELPQYYSSLAYITEPQEIFESVISFIDFSTIISKIKTAMNTITRDVGTDIAFTLHHYKSLVQELMKIQYPDEKNEENLKNAERQTSKIVKFLIEENLNQELELYKQQYKTQNSKYLGLTETIIFISDMELNPIYSLKSPKSLKNNELNLSLFYTSKSTPAQFAEVMVHDKWKQLPPPMETRSKTQSESDYNTSKDYYNVNKNKYENVPKKRDESTERSRPSSRSRRFSPSSGKKRLMFRTKSGNYRSISRNRIFTTRKDGKLTPRGVSKSPEKINIDDGKCQLCFRFHPPPCHKYGTITPTTTICSTCSNGKHSPSICLEKTKPTTRNPSPFNNSLN